MTGVELNRVSHDCFPPKLCVWIAKIFMQSYFKLAKG
jgi:hypothetical protein